ncbi:choice-of-anchor M domain-containing protein [Bowdeniella nasicola]|nr:choice-of-anchor M domain-containing protein [Bowdeniella nasicola]
MTSAFKRAWLAIAMVTLIGATSAQAATEPPPSDPALEQKVDANEKVSNEPAEIATGHVDMGPKLIDGAMQAAVRDDSVSPPVWRTLDSAVLRVNDKAITELPEDPRYEFLGIPAGTKVHVVPQTQNQDVIWLGWNTQDPAIVDMIDRGVTMTYRGHTGPGEVHLFVESGTFDAPPTQLWSSTGKPGQDFWVNTNTHTHANWVFTEPGVHLVDFTIKTTTRDGKEVRADGTLRFAVGDAANADEARTATSEASSAPAEESSAAPAESSAAPSEAAAPEEKSSSSALPIVLAAGGSLLVLGALAAFFTMRTRKLKAQVNE